MNIFQRKIEAHFDLSLAQATLHVTHLEGSTRTHSSNALYDLDIFLEQSPIENIARDQVTPNTKSRLAEQLKFSMSQNGRRK